MRIRNLDLIRYGHFTDQPLELSPAAPDLHIVVGPNEAGKSTVLAAIEDLLFGIPARSPLNFLHAYPSMRLGATLEANGDTLRFRRRKGNKRTVLTPEDVPLQAGERALMPFLASATRDFFERMFSLDHLRLRKGGEEILDDRSEIGQMLFAAGSGIQDLRGRLQGLDDEADSLWARRRSAKRKFFHAEDRLKEARRTIREHTVTAAKWHELRRELNESETEFGRLSAVVQEKDIERRQLERVRRLAPYVHEKARLESRIAGLGTVSSLPDDARASLEQSERKRDEANLRLEDQQAQLNALKQEQEGAQWNRALTGRASDIKGLDELRIEVRRERIDLPKRERELAAAEAGIREAARELGWDEGDIGELVQRIPNPTKVSNARAVLGRRDKLFARADSAREALEGARQRLLELEQRAAAQGKPRDVARLAAALASINPDIGARALEVEREAAAREAEAELHRRDLRPQPTPDAAIDPLDVPPRSAVEAFRDDRRENDRQLREGKLQLAEAERELQDRIRIRTRFVEDERPVSAGEVRQVRKVRDAGWSLVRRRYIDSGEVTEAELSAFQGELPSLASAYEAAVAAADLASDRRGETAKAAAGLAELNRTIAAAEDRVASLGAGVEELTRISAQLDSEWNQLWESAPLEPSGPGAMLRWLDNHARMCRASSQAATARRKAETVRRDEREASDTIRSELASLGLDDSATQALGLLPLANFAADVVRAQTQLASEARQVELDRRNAAAEVSRMGAAVAAARKSTAGWQENWNAVVAAIGLDPKADRAVISQQLGIIGTMRQSSRRAEDLRVQRVEKIRRDIEEFRQEAGEILSAVAGDLLDYDPFDAVPVLKQRLDEDLEVEREARQRQARIAKRRSEIQKIERAQRQARAGIARLRAAAGVGDTAALRAEIDKTEQRRDLRADLSKVLRTLRQQGDGLAIEVIEDECRGANPDQIAARQDEVEQELKELRNELDRAKDRRRAASEEFKRVGGENRAALAESARQEAIAEMRDVAERYVRARSAALLLRWAIDRNRREKQAPLLRRASGLFAELTSQSFERLELDFDGDRPELVGCRPSAERVPVSGMSGGTVDQLYLALRVAALEDYLRDAQPLPFVADDLFINFDDRRAGAGFRVLGELARSCQVIFFTHHEHLVDVAQSALDAPAAVVRLTQ